MPALARLIQAYLDSHPDVLKKDVAAAAKTSPQSFSGWLDGSTFDLKADNIVGLADAIHVHPMDVVEAISQDRGIPTQRPDVAGLRPETRMLLGVTEKLGPERVKAVTRIAMEFADDENLTAALRQPPS